MPTINFKKNAKRPDDPIYLGMASSGTNVDKRLANIIPKKKYFPNSMVLFQKLLKKVIFSVLLSHPHFSEVK